MTIKNTLIVLLASVAMMLTVACSSKADRGAATDVVASDTADFNDPIIDESTLIADSASTDEPKELGIPPRRFNTKAQALEFMQNSGHWDRYQQGIIPRMLDDNFPYADRLLNNSYDYFIVADKQSMNVALFDKYGVLVRQYPMACARNYGTKHKRSDCRTPEGFFYAQGIYDSTDWLYTDDNGYTSPTRGVYGPRFIRVKADVTASVGIHGTGSPGALGKRVSHGCIRVANASILDLVKYARAGMPIIVNPSDRDVAVNRSEGYGIQQIHTGLTPAPAGMNVSAEVDDNYPAKPIVADTVAIAPVSADTTGVAPAENPNEPVATPKEPAALPDTTSTH